MNPVIFFNDTATTEIYTLSLHDALPILNISGEKFEACATGNGPVDAAIKALKKIVDRNMTLKEDRKSTRLNSSHANISYAVFCLTKNKSRSCFCLRSTRCFSLYVCVTRS